MADAKIDFNDGAAATLKSPVPAPGNRFRGWTPDRIPIGPVEFALGTGAPSQFEFRTDYIATFEIHNLRPSDLTIWGRLKAHLIGGGQVTVTTADSGGTTYTCKLAPGTVPELRQMDERMVEFAARLTLKNTSAAMMICSY